MTCMKIQQGCPNTQVLSNRLRLYHTILKNVCALDEKFWVSTMSEKVLPVAVQLYKNQSPILHPEKTLSLDMLFITIPVYQNIDQPHFNQFP